MAARTTSKVKQSGGSRPSVKVTAAKKAGGRKAPAKSPRAKSVKKRAATNSIAAVDGMATDLLIEQNEALRAELEQAQARIAELEELNKNVVNRIDWVIDSLQGALKR